VAHKQDCETYRQPLQESAHFHTVHDKATALSIMPVNPLYAYCLDNLFCKYKHVRPSDVPSCSDSHAINSKSKIFWNRSSSYCNKISSMRRDYGTQELSIATVWLQSACDVTLSELNLTIQKS